MRVTFECEVNEVGSFCGEHRISLTARGARVRGAGNVRNVAMLYLPRKTLRDIPPYHHVRLTIEVVGPLSDEELDEREAWEREGDEELGFDVTPEEQEKRAAKRKAERDVAKATKKQPDLFAEEA